MKSIIQIASCFALMLLATLNTYAQTATATIEKVWLEHNVVQKGEKGVKIHIKFAVSNMLNQTGKVMAWFYYDNKTPIEGVSNNSYATPTRKLTTLDGYTPIYEKSTFNDFQLFLPFSVLDQASVKSGNYNVYFNVAVTNASGKEIANSNNHYFNYSAQNNTQNNYQVQVVNDATNDGTITQLEGYNFTTTNIKLHGTPNLRMLATSDGRSYYISSPQPLKNADVRKSTEMPIRLKGYWKTAYYDGVMKTEEVFFVTEYYNYNQRLF